MYTERKSCFHNSTQKVVIFVSSWFQIMLLFNRPTLGAGKTNQLMLLFSEVLLTALDTSSAVHSLLQFICAEFSVSMDSKKCVFFIREKVMVQTLTESKFSKRTLTPLQVYSERNWLKWKDFAESLDSKMGVIPLQRNDYFSFVYLLYIMNGWSEKPIIKLFARMYTFNKTVYKSIWFCIVILLCIVSYYI